MSLSWSRTTLALAGGLTALTLLTACGGGSGAAGSEGLVTLTYWGWTKGTKQAVDAFNATHRDTKVRFEEIPSGTAGGYAKISNAVKAGNAPDLVSVEYPTLPEFVSQGAVRDITPYVTPGLKRKLLPQAVQLTTLGGRNWAVPFDAAPQVYYYRKDFFTRHKIEVPRTWDAFRAAAAAVKKADPKARIGTFFPDDPTTFEAMAWQAGAHWFATEGDSWKLTTTDPATRKVTDYWQGLLKDDLVHTHVSFSPGWTNSLKGGGTVGYLGASWGAGVLKGTLPDQSGKWAAAPVPSWDGRPASGMLGGSTTAVTKSSRHTEAAVRFATWMSTSAEAVKARVASGESSAYPAATALRPVARRAFDTRYYGGQDVYALFDAAAASVDARWGWGPATSTTNTTLKDEFGKAAGAGGGGTGSLAAAVRAGSDATVRELRKRGLKVMGR
ncbi:sugar ABC transporter substrate-binding protein [Streptomyces chrestomyceticus JCM 4735]|uniref:Sugar ABC transporter substrate-binding protein n=1 Tax=Streptomyces chrestomyceticus JCM 4735 TaxID=1306181 RepID=A0A7U9PZJ7_9ACTN|nr:extracellular solute-binding protein [Streptomyces chrestomyceticus]GCD36875.1 sugar ABC transporter substrate-binding protein [Streptomyces chrestomyceticus JCM 4735]